MSHLLRFLHIRLASDAWPRWLAVWCVCASVLALAACDKPQPTPAPRELDFGEVHRLGMLLAKNRALGEGWAVDVLGALQRLNLHASQPHVCAALAVIAQESGFKTDPPVPGLSDIVVRHLQNAARSNPAVFAGLNIRLRQRAANGKPFFENLQAVRTERALEDWYNEFTAAHVTGGLLRLIGADVDSLIATLGPMQVSVAFARDFARANRLPAQNLRAYLHSREGGVFYGTAHLLKYDAHYSRWLYVFADYNAGHYASRNAGFQHMVAALSGQKLAPDGDVLSYVEGGAGQPSNTSRAVLLALQRAGRAADPAAVLTDLRREKQADFSRTPTWKAIAELHRAKTGRVLTEAMPHIVLKSDKIQRRLTTEWFANRVNGRFDTCMKARL